MNTPTTPAPSLSDIPTPRTEVVLSRIVGGLPAFVLELRDHARQLERELYESQDQLGNWHETFEALCEKIGYTEEIATQAEAATGKKWASDGIAWWWDKQLATARQQAIDMAAQVLVLREALEDYAHPLKALQREADREGVHLNGRAALELANDADFIKGIARKGLESTSVPEVIAKAKHDAEIAELNQRLIDRAKGDVEQAARIDETWRGRNAELAREVSELEAHAESLGNALKYVLDEGGRHYQPCTCGDCINLNKALAAHEDRKTK